MGFLSGAYGKLMAGKYLRDLQHQLNGITQRHRRVTREIAQKEKMYQSQQRNMKYALQAQMQSMIQGGVLARIDELQASGKSDEAQQLAALGQMYGSAMGGNAQMFGNIGIGSISQSATMTYSMIQQHAQMQFMQAQNIWQNMFEMQQDADLQALKDLEQDLQTEKDSLESQIKIANQEYEAKKEEEKQGAQNLKPDYTGQG